MPTLKESLPSQGDLLRVGVDPDEKERCGTFLQEDSKVVACGVRQEGVDLVSVIEALERFPDAQRYLWGVLDEDAGLGDFQNGYFIRACKDVKPLFPVQACLYMSKEGARQHVHNIVVVEEGAELHVITGCTSSVKRGIHVGVSEFYVKRGGTLHFTMIHAWGDEVEALPRTGIVVEENGVFISDYICMHPGKMIKMYPTTYLVGPGAVARFQSVLVAVPGAFMDIGSRVYMQALETKAEIISRAVSMGGTVIARGHLIGEHPHVKAHLECRGLLLREGGVIHAIPELEGRAVELEMTHEAAVGKIAKEEVEYLMSRGLTEDEATAAIVRGFLNVDIMGLPDPLKKDLDRIIRRSDQESL
jgi:Fe-S cluster assembly scaffold protein SufB